MTTDPTGMRWSRCASTWRMTSAWVFHSLPLAQSRKTQSGQLLGAAAPGGSASARKPASTSRGEPSQNAISSAPSGAGLRLDPQQPVVARADVEPDPPRGAHVEAPSRPADHMGERHRQVRLALGALALVLLEDDGVELGAALVEGVEALAETGDVLARREGQGEPDAVDGRAVAERPTECRP